MRVIHFSDAINQLHQVINQVVSDCDVAIISCKGGEAVVLMSQGAYNSIIETIYLLKSSTNAVHLNTSLAQYRQC